MATTSRSRSSGAIAFTMASASAKMRACFPRFWISADHALQIEPFRLGNRLRLEDGGDHHLIGERQAAGEGILQHVAAHGVRARLQHHPQARLRIARPQRQNRLLDGRGMMGKVVDDGYSIDLRLQLEAPLYAAKGCESLCYHIF